MITIHTRRRVRRALLLLVAAVSLVGLQSPGAWVLDGAGAAPPEISLQAADIVGAGSNKIACMLCAGVLIAVGGTTVVGLIAVSAAWPEAVLACAAACILAAT